MCYFATLCNQEITTAADFFASLHLRHENSSCQFYSHLTAQKRILTTTRSGKKNNAAAIRRGLLMPANCISDWNVAGAAADFHWWNYQWMVQMSASLHWYYRWMFWAIYLTYGWPILQVDRLQLLLLSSDNGKLVAQISQFVVRPLLPPARICNCHCLSISNFVQKLPNGFAWNFQGRLAMGPWTTD